MVDRIKIENFGVLKDIDIEIRRFNIIIGNQAQGKSLLASLIYYFNSLDESIMKFFLANVSNFDENKDYIKLLNEKLLYNFTELFPKYLLDQNNTFSIRFLFTLTTQPFIITKDADKNIKIELPTFVSNTLKKIITDFKKYDKRIKSTTKRKNNDMEKEKEYLKISSVVNTIEKLNLNRNPHFIPASRSFLSYLENNTFTLGRNFNLNKVIMEFGNYIEKVKDMDLNVFEEGLNKKILELRKDILKGEYFREENIDYLKTDDNRKVKMSDASSGQQEILPIVLTLMNVTFSGFYIIEEPEAHLYPSTQKKVVKLLAYFYNLHCNLIVTTHSPYILTSLNNLIQAHNTFLKKPEMKDKIDKIVDVASWVDFNNVSAYYLIDGKCENILNTEERLINAEFIDKISEEIGEEFSQLIDIEFEE